MPLYQSEVLAPMWKLNAIRVYNISSPRLGESWAVCSLTGECEMRVPLPLFPVVGGGCSELLAAVLTAPQDL